MKSITEFLEFKQKNRPISMVTCYDYLSAKIIACTNIDAVLVGDSAAMVMHGFSTTVNADINMMLAHVAAVARGLPGRVMIADLPFLAHTKGKKFLMEGVDAIMKAGANAIKIEGAGASLKSIRFMTDADVPVMGHLGLTPQSVNKLGGFRIRGRDDSQKAKLLDDSKRLEDAGVFALVLEMIPASLAAEITASLTVPTIGIGAGNMTSGQILVLHDLLGMNPGFRPKFVKRFLDGEALITEALNRYDAEVKSLVFPSEKESY
jgi:3-methyl-2-oxobutanoate hydroxymethyltransferase